MRYTDIDDKWTFRRGLADSLTAIESDPGMEVDLPHDGMIGTKVSPDAPAGPDMGYFTGDVTNYTRYVYVPEDWSDECIGLSIDGAMLNATIEVNGCLAGRQHYGYAPFYVDITGLVTFGDKNRITIHTNTSMQPNSRWYSGSGLYRGIKLCHGPQLHITQDGVYVYTKEVSDGYAFLEARVDTENSSTKNSLAKVTVTVCNDKDKEEVACVSRVIQIGPGQKETAYMTVTLADPVLWDIDDPYLYKVTAKVEDIGEYRTHFIPNKTVTVDEASVLFGVRTITADVIHGLRINGKTVKLKGGCLHHDNGLLGAVSLYESEARKVTKLKEVGFNAIRTAHNPPSAALIEACDRLGMFVFDEAFDAWGMAKRSGDYSQFFDDHWEHDLEAFIRRDRSHPSVIIWSTGNEIPERGGLNNGYTLAARIAEKVRSLDGSRPVSNGICSFWSGLDDHLAKDHDNAQNGMDDASLNIWESGTEPFTNGLDIVGYNYMEDLYEKDHELYPERVILGSENFPKEIGFRWPLVERLPYVTGEFTWTAWDYIGEAGLGKAAYVDHDDPDAPKYPWDLMPQNTSPYPWRLANDADFDITGHMCPQGAYRSVVWGSDKTYIYAKHPDTYGKKEITSMWGFPYLYKNWNYRGYEGRSVEIMVFTNADEAELLINGRSAGRKAVSAERPMPCSVSFDIPYESGVIEAVSYTNGREVSRDSIKTAGAAAELKVSPEKPGLRADGHDLVCIGIEVLDKDGIPVPDAGIDLKAEVSGAGYLAGFGSANPVTEEDYTDDTTVTYRGRAQAIIRSGYESGKIMIKISADGLPEVSTEIDVISQ